MIEKTIPVSENKVLTHPSSVDSLTTSAGTEDHVSMGGFAARKALTVVEHVETGLCVESPLFVKINHLDWTRYVCIGRIMKLF